MDTEVIAQSPLRLTVSGMGDAMATYFEARACVNSGAGNFAGGTVGVTSFGIAKLCYDTLVSDGLKAKIALESQALTPPSNALSKRTRCFRGLASNPAASPPRTRFTMG